MSRLYKEYKIHSLLGAGSFGAVLKCTHLTDEGNYAIKVTSAGDADAMREVQNLVTLPGHKNIVQYYTCWKEQLAKTELEAILSIGASQIDKLRFLMGLGSLEVICIQMELCGKDLRTTLGSLKSVDKERVTSWFNQLLDGLEHIHKFALIHRDLKPDNILLALRDHNVLKIGDLGVATQHRTSHSLTHTSKTGTPIYLAPEQEGSRYGKSVDIFALGIIFLEILHPEVQPQNNGDNAGPLCTLVSDLKYKKRIPASVVHSWPNESKAILEMTSLDSDQRPATSEVRTAISNSNIKSRSLSRDADKHADSTTKQLIRNAGASDKSNTSPINLRALLNIGSNRGDQIIHSGVKCSGCGAKDFKGIRWKCVVCDDYDLCDRCEKRVGIHPESHNFLKIKSPTSTRNAAGVDGKMAVVKDSSENNFFHLKGVKYGEIRLTVPEGRTNIRCTDCNETLKEGDDYFLCDGQIFCWNHFWSTSRNKCGRCGERFSISEFLTFWGFRFYGDSLINIHSRCFKCCHCQKRIRHDEQNFTKDGISYCAADFHRLFSPKCAKCGDFCTAKFVEVEGPVHFHSECFNCFKCKTQLTTYFKIGDHFICPNCFGQSN